MKGLSKRIVILIIILVYFGNSLKAQKAAKFNFIGLNPSLTVEPFYDRGEFDINILPLVYQRPLTKRFDIRLSSIYNLGIRNNGNEISHMGLETALPVFFKPKEKKKESSKGFFIAPIISMTKNRIEEHNNLGLWLEPGYNLLFDNRYAMTFGLQFGGTYFAYGNTQNRWGNHFGVKVIFGRWI